MNRLLMFVAISFLFASCVRRDDPAQPHPQDELNEVIDEQGQADPTDRNDDPSDGSPFDVGHESSDDSPVDLAFETPIQDIVEPALPELTIASWNLHNFSRWGTSEYRIDEIASIIEDIQPDVLALQELRIDEDTDGSPPQAWDALLDLLPQYDGVHAQWSTYDTVVGLLYRTETVQLQAWDTFFEDESYAFPRDPLLAELLIGQESRQIAVDVIVIHLKAFSDSSERRVEACNQLHQFVQERDNQNIVIIGDFNDDPYDTGSSNVFTGTFLNPELDYRFVTATLPPESVTSTGYYHWVDGVRIDGEFLDHAVITTTLYDAYASVTPSIYDIPVSMDDWEDDYSDHIPIIVDFEP